VEYTCRAKAQGLRGLFDPGFFAAHGRHMAAGTVRIAFWVYMCMSLFELSSSVWAHFPLVSRFLSSHFSLSSLRP
jgi:hypothetical protein